MKKLFSFGCLLVALAIGGMIVGCTQQQVELVAGQAGLASIVAWVGVDNPTDEQKAVASQVVSIIKSNAIVVVQGGSYYDAVLPTLTTYINQYIPQQSQAIATLAGGWVLTGIDTFFAINPQYVEKAGQAVKVVNSFCDGALVGLSMSKDSPVVKAATRGTVENSKTRKTIL